MAYKRNSPIPVIEGGTNASSMTTTDGVVYFDGTSLVTTAVGSSTQVLTSNGTGMAPTFQNAASGGAGSVTNWTDVTSGTQALAVDSGYSANFGTLVTLTLPATSALGSIIVVTGKGSGGWLIAQNSGMAASC